MRKRDLLRASTAERLATLAADAGVPVEQLEIALDSLPWHYAGVLACRYGIDCDPETRAEVAVRYGVTRERIRQIEVKYLERMRTCVAQLPRAARELQWARVYRTAWELPDGSVGPRTLRGCGRG